MTRIKALDADTTFRHDAVWTREPTTGQERVYAGGGPDPVGTLAALAADLAEPLFVVVVLRVPRGGPAARLESEAMSHAEVAAFCEEFRGFFSDDGRANLWVGATAGGGLLVLDEHDLIYAYGPLDAYEATLRSRGYAPGFAEPPVPHEHHYLPGYDDAEEALRARAWRRVLPFDD